MPLSVDAVRSIAGELLRPGRFLVGAGVSLAYRHVPAEPLRWEVFQGRLLAPEQTRQEATFESWNVHLVGPGGPSPEPIVSLKLGAGPRLFVVRAVDSYVQEGYDSGGGVYLTREARRWARELVASFDPARFDDLGHLREEVAAAVGRAIVGSRLPLTSVEAPLPFFTFGRLFYLDSPSGGDSPRPLGDELEEIDDRPGAHRRLEAWLRAVPIEDMARGARQLAGHCPAVLPSLWQVFQDVSL